MNSITDALIKAKFTTEKIKTHLIYVLPFSAIDEAPVYVTGYLISSKIPVQRIQSQFVNKTCNFSHQKNLFI